MIIFNFYGSSIIVGRPIISGLAVHGYYCKCNLKRLFLIKLLSQIDDKLWLPVYHSPVDNTFNTTFNQCITWMVHLRVLFWQKCKTIENIMTFVRFLVIYLRTRVRLRLKKNTIVASNKIRSLDSNTHSIVDIFEIT